jgi:Fe-S-cluster containining protein
VQADAGLSQADVAAASRGEVQLAQADEDSCEPGQVMIGGKCRTLGKKTTAAPVVPQSDSSTEDNTSSEEACPDGQVMIGGKCRALGKKTTAAPVVPQSGNATEDNAATEEACPSGQVMIGGKCRALGKKTTTAPVVPQSDSSTEDNTSSEEACPDGQVMIGGKCRALGKKTTAAPVEPQSETATEDNAATEEVCPSGQVMIGGKCRALGKKTTAAPVVPQSETATEDNAATEEACPDGAVMIGGKCRALGKKTTAAPIVPQGETATEDNTATEEACPSGQVMIGGRCRALGNAGNQPAPHQPEPDSSDQIAEPSQDPDASGMPFRAASWGGIVRDGPGRQFKKLVSLIEGAPVEILERASDLENDYPWFKIDIGNAQVGYMWGGILCSIDFPRDGLYQVCESVQQQSQPVTAPQTSNPDSGLTWQSQWFNDAAKGGALTSQLILGVPETDATKLFGACVSGEDNGVPVLLIWGDVARKKRGSKVDLRFANERIDTSYRAEVTRSSSGEGLEGYRLRLAPDDPLWEAMAASSTMTYGDAGSLNNELDLSGSRRAITAFLSGCRLIAGQAAN